MAEEELVRIHAAAAVEAVALEEVVMTVMDMMIATDNHHRHLLQVDLDLVQATVDFYHHFLAFSVNNFFSFNFLYFTFAIYFITQFFFKHRIYKEKFVIQN